MTLPRITLSPAARRRKTPPQTAKWRELTLAALLKIGRKGNRAPNSDAGGESWPKMTSCPACGAMNSANATPCPRWRFSAAPSSRSDSQLCWRSPFCTVYCSDIYDAGEGAVTSANSAWMRSACPIGAGKTLCTRSPPLPLSKLRSRAPDARASRGPQQKCGRQS
jgi:hypothetical protein